MWFQPVLQKLDFNLVCLCPHCKRAIQFQSWNRYNSNFGSQSESEQSVLIHLGEFVRVQEEPRDKQRLRLVGGAIADLGALSRLTMRISLDTERRLIVIQHSKVILLFGCDLT